MADAIPSCSDYLFDRLNCRFWKRLLRDAGKRRVFELVEPEIRARVKRIRNRGRREFLGVQVKPLTDRKRKLLIALDEIRESRELHCTREIVGDFGAFVYGTTRITLHVLCAGAFLLQGMVAKRNFERHVMASLAEMAEIDAEFVRSVGVELGREQR